MKVALVAIVKNESNLAEWLCYHTKIGFDKIYLLTNDWTPNVSEGYEIMPYNGRGIQVMAYNCWIERYGHLYDYAAFIDADEFIFIQEPGAKVQDILVDRCLALNWVFFGTKTEPGNNVVDRFVYRDANADRHIKTIMKLEPGVKMLSPHFCNAPTYSTIGECVVGPFSKLPTVVGAFIAHYYYQDYEHWKRKIARGRADSIKYKRTLQEWNAVDYNKVRDERLKLFLYGN